MASILSEPVNMIEEGLIQTPDRVAILHRNVGTAAAAQLVMWGISDTAHVLLVGTLDTYITAGESTVAGECYQVKALPGAPQAALVGTAVGDIIFLPSSITLASGEELYPIVGTSLRYGALYADRTATVLKVKSIPCQMIQYVLVDNEQLLDVYDFQIITKQPIDTFDGVTS